MTRICFKKISRIFFQIFYSTILYIIYSNNTIPFAYAHNIVLDDNVIIQIDFLFLVILIILLFGVYKFHNKTSVILKKYNEDLIDSNKKLKFENEQRIIAEKKLEESINKYKTIYDNAQAGLFQTSIIDGKMLECNDLTAKILGFASREECIQNFIASERYVNFEDRKILFDELDKHGMVNNFYTQFYKNDGNICFINISGKIFSNLGYFVGIAKDISEQRKTEKALQESEEKLRTILESTRDWIWEINTKGEIAYSNKAIKNILGYTSEQVIGKSCFIFMDDHIKKITYERFLNFLKNRQPWRNFVLTWKNSNGNIVYTESIAEPIISSTGDILGIRGIDRDITERIKAEEEIRESRKFKDELIKTANVIIVALDKNGLVQLLNPMGEKITGYSEKELLGKNWFDVLIPKDKYSYVLDEFNKATIPGIPPKIVENSIILKNGEERRISWSTSILKQKNEVTGLICFGLDITEQKKAMDIMIHSEKMLSVGNLAAGMAHEINNPLAGIIQNVDVLKNRLSKDLPKNKQTAIECDTTIEKINDYTEKRNLNELIEAISSSGNRAAKIVRNMLSFSRKNYTKFIESNICDLLDKILDIASADFDFKKNYDFKNIKIIKEYDFPAPKAECDPARLEQVFLNILSNGAHAMFENRNVTKCPPRFIIRVRQNFDRIRVEIENNGPPISEKIKNHIFEPFFTTKKVGEGTGLGLSIAYFIITEYHNGKFWVETGSNNTTNFIIEIPSKESK